MLIETSMSRSQTYLHVAMLSIVVSTAAKTFLPQETSKVPSNKIRENTIDVQDFISKDKYSISTATGLGGKDKDVKDDYRITFESNNEDGSGRRSEKSGVVQGADKGWTNSNYFNFPLESPDNDLHKHSIKHDTLYPPESSLVLEHPHTYWGQALKHPQPHWGQALKHPQPYWGQALKHPQPYWGQTVRANFPDSIGPIKIVPKPVPFRIFHNIPRQVEIQGFNDLPAAEEVPRVRYIKEPVFIPVHFKPDFSITHVNMYHPG